MWNGDWGLRIGDCRFVIGPNPQSPIPIFLVYILSNKFYNYFDYEFRFNLISIH